MDCAGRSRLSKQGAAGAVVYYFLPIFVNFPFSGTRDTRAFDKHTQTHTYTQTNTEIKPIARRELIRMFQLNTLSPIVGLIGLVIFFSNLWEIVYLINSRH